MKRLLFLIALGVAGAYLIRTFCFEGIYIASESMEPTFPKDLHVMVNKLDLFFNNPKRGQVIMFESPVDGKKGMVKRVIAIGGDTVELRKKVVFVNGAALDEPYVQFLQPDIVFVGDNMPPMTVPEDHVFLLGDNRDVSGDSRDWKSPAGEKMPFLPLSKVKGIVQQP